MRPDVIKRLLTAILICCSCAAFGQMPYSPCGPSGGKRADVLGVDAKYSSPGSSAPVFNIPAGTKSISVYISSETGVTSGGNDFAQGDEDFITISAIIDIASGTSSGYVNYAKSTHMDGSGTNVYGWQSVPLGAFIPAASKTGDAAPDLNNVNFTISGTALTITQSFTGMHSSFYVQYLSPYSNSLNLLEPQVKALLHGTSAASTDLLVPIPAGANVIFLSGKGTNSSYQDLNTNDGTEEGYANLRFTIDLDKNLTTGIVTLANGGSANRRSTYAINSLSTAYSGKLVSSTAVDGDYNGKSSNQGAVGIYNPQIYISGNNLVIKRDADYARDFDDAYIVEFYKRTGQGMSADFVSSDIKSIPTGVSSTTGITRTFTIPPGTNAIYFNETGNAVNVDRESNENSLEAYAYIDLTTETASGYFYQQVGLSLTQRRDDNYAFTGVPLNNSSTRSHANTVGFKSSYDYDISFSLSADKSQLTVTNKTGLANPYYQILLSSDYYGSKPDIAFSASGITFTKISADIVRANVAVCNPGAGNSNGGMPVSFYHGDPTANPAAKLLYTSTFNEDIEAGECKNFSFDIDLSSFDNLNIDLTVIINDDGSFVSGGIGNTVGTPFTLTSLATQHTTYQECYYGNNLITQAIAVNNSPVADPDPDKSSGATGTYTYLNYFNAGSSTGAKIADADLSIVDPDAPNLSSASIILTNTPDAGSEALYLNGTLPAGITISGDGTNTITLTGQAPQSDYISALKMIEYRNRKGSPNTVNRTVTTTVSDGTETSPTATTTIVILTNPRINVTGNATAITDNSVTVSATDGTDFGFATTAVIAHTFSIGNIGTGTISLTASPALSITGDAGFTISTQPSANTIAVGESTAFVVSFDPAAHTVGVYTAIVRILNNDPDAGRSDYTFTVAATVNRLPVVSNNSISGAEDQVLAFAATAFSGSYNDPDGTALNKIKVISLPLNGSFSLNGVSITVGQEIPSSQLGNITFTPTANWNGSTSFAWSASDGISFAAAPAHTTIDITPVNDAPQITLPPGIAVTEDVPAPLKDISFTDIDAATGNVTVTFSASSGALSAVSGNGVVVSGTSSSLVLNGTITDINSFIAGKNLTYSTTQDPPASLSIDINISDNGNTGAGGALQDTKSLMLGITAVNDLPTGTGDTKTTAENTPVSGAVMGTDGDGDQLTFIKATDPGQGTVVVNLDGTYTYTPNTNYNGSDNFTITVSDGHGGTAVVAVNITVTPVNEDPAGTGDTKTTPENTPVSGAVTGTDGDGDQITFTKAIDPGHGTVVVSPDGTYTYTPNTNYNGSDNFTITISDGHGSTAIVAVSITVTPVNETPTGTGDAKTTAENIPVHGAVTGTDGDGDQLTFTKAIDPDHGTVAVNSDGTYTYTPNTNYNGPDNFTITISDDHGGAVTVTVNITVTPVNEIPTGTGDAKTTSENTPVSGAVSGTDGDGDALTFAKITDPAHGTVIVNADGSYTYTPNVNYNGLDNFTIDISDGNGGNVIVKVLITVTPTNETPTGTGDAKVTSENTPVSGAVTGTDGDGDQLTFTKATDPAHGTVVVNPDGTYTYTPDANYNGPDNFTITISDGNGGTAIVAVSITVTPVNEDPTGTGDTKTTAENTPVSGAVTGTDGDGDQITFTKATDPGHGTVVVSPDGTYTYTPNANYNGPDNFTITISDGNGGTVIVAVSVTVTPVNEDPAGTGDTKTTAENTPVSGAVSGTDGDGDVLTFTKATDPGHGTVVVNSDGTYTYTPNTNYNGADNFTITIRDDHGGTVTVTVNITVTPVNEIPTGTGDAKTIPENTPVSGAVTGLDGDGDPLSYTKATDPAHGTVVVNPDGTYTYTPNTNYYGLDNFTITISDGHSGTAVVAINITVTPVNEIPTGTGDAKTTAENIPVHGAVTGTDGDGDQLTFTKATDPGHGIVGVNSDGTYTYTPNTNYNGPDNFTITISDGHGGTVTVTVNITVTPVNEIPTGTGDAKTTSENIPVSGAVSGTDGDGDALTFTKITDPAHGTVVVSANGSYTYTPNVNYNGVDNFTIDISDGNGGNAIVKVVVTVTPTNEIPTGTGDTKTTAENTSVMGAVTGLDGDGDPLSYTKATDPAHGTVVVNPDGTYTYSPNANYNGPDNFTITISDGNGGTVIVAVSITVTPVNEDPTGTGDTKTTVENTPVHGAVTGTDGDGDQITFTKATDPGQGTVVVNLDGTYTYTPNTNYNGSDNFTITISDGHGGTAVVAVNITVTPVNETPTGTGDAKTIAENIPVHGVVTGTDGDGDQLTFTKATDPGHGTVIVNSDGTYTYTPNTNYNGLDNFTITISDDHGGAVTVTINITVTPVNEIPTGTGDAKTTSENTPVSGAVSGTDGDGDALTFTKITDPAHGTVVVSADGSYTYTPNANYNGLDNFTIDISDGNGGNIIVKVLITVTPVNEIPIGTGDVKTVSENTPVSGAVTGVDGDGDALTFTKATDPGHGTVTVNSDGTYTYTPNANYNGFDYFTVTVSDGNGGIVTVAVNITVIPINENPTGTGDAKTTNENTPVSGAVTGVDGDGDAVSYAKGTDPIYGAAVVNVDGNYTYTPNTNYNGPDNFTIVISDGNGGTATVTVNLTVTPVNENPTGTGDAKTTAENIPVHGAVTGTDGDGNQLTFTKATDPVHGTVIVNSDGTYTYTPNTNYNGPDNFIITISDDHGGTVTVTVNITVTPVNEIPTGTGDAKTTSENTPVSGAVTGTDGDGDALTFTKITDPAHGSVIVNADASYTYTPNANYNGVDNFTIDISDGNGGNVIVKVLITVTPVNEDPTATGDVKTTIENTPVSGAVTGADEDGDALTFTKATDPGHGAAVVNSDGTYVYTPNTNYNGPDNFTITISDSHGGKVTVTVSITVTPVNEIPTATGDAKTTAENTPVSGAVTGTDGDGDALTFTKATDPVHGTVVINSNGTYTYTPNTNYNGPDNFTISISDGNGGTAAATVNITVTPLNETPTGAGDARITNENTPVSGAVTGSDADGDALTFTRSTYPFHGTVVVHPNGTYTYTPNANYSGPDNFTITISDGNGGNTTVTVRITVIPAVVNAGITLVKTGILRSDNISITYGFTITNTGNATLYNVTVTDPMLGLNKTLTGVLQPGASASMTAIYRLTQNDRDKGIVTNTATVKGQTVKNIEVTDISGTAVDNDNPTKSRVPRSPEAFDDDADTKANTPVTVPVLNNDDAAQSTFNPGSIAIIRQPLHGKVLINSDGTTTYIPGDGFSGDDHFTYQVQDREGYLTNVASVVLHVHIGDLKIPTLFTPNSDGKNDVFEVRGLQQYAENELVIINRWGNEVYRQKNYQNNWRGDGLNEGTYYYILRVKKVGGSGWEVLKGYTTLIRKFKK